MDRMIKPFTYKDILIILIHFSPSQKLNVQEIYNLLLSSVYEYFKIDVMKTKACVRSTLSRESCFVKIGVTHYWGLSNDAYSYIQRRNFEWRSLHHEYCQITGKY